MGSSDFNGTTAYVSVAPGTVASGSGDPYTFACWANWDATGGGGTGHFISNTRDALRIESAVTTLRMRCGASVTTSSTITNAPTFAAGVWYCIIATFDPVDAKGRIYYGTEYIPMTECGYSAQVAAAGTRTATGATQYIGALDTSNNFFDGRIKHAASMEWLMNRNEMERYRQGDMSVVFRGGLPRIYLTLSDSNPTADSSHRGSVTTAVNTAASSTDPLVQFRWDWPGGRRPL